MFTPGLIGTLSTANRFIRSATAEFGANSDGTITEKYLELYQQLALGEIGVIIQGHLYIMDEGKAHEKMAGISHSRHMKGLKQIIESIHSTGLPSTIVAQLNHGGAHSVSTKAPSLREDKKTLEMTKDDVEDVINNFGSAAQKAKEAGYDGVQIHAAHGYLLSQFLSKKTNLREDEWGGSPEKRFHFLSAVIGAVGERVGDDFPVLIKLNLDDCLPKGIPLSEALNVATAVSDLGISAIEVSGGMVDSERGAARKGITPGKQEAYFRSMAREVKGMVDCPVILVGGLKSPPVINDVLESGDADLVALGRALIREPRLPLEWLDGRDTPADCISCNRCALYKDRPLRCETLMLEQKLAEKEEE